MTMALSATERMAALARLWSDPAASLRMACARCGSHVFVQAALRPAGQCRNCGSYELAPLDGASDTPGSA